MLLEPVPDLVSYALQIRQEMGMQTAWAGRGPVFDADVAFDILVCVCELERLRLAG
jgi:hypothetical protein